MQETVDAKADMQAFLLWLDMNVRCPYLGRVVEHRLQQLDHRRILQPGGRKPHGGKVDDASAKLLFQLARQAGNFPGATIHAVDRLQQVAFIDDRQRDVAFQQARDFIVGKQVSRVGQPHQQHLAPVFQGDRAETARLHFGNQLYRLRPEVVLPEVDVRNVHLPRQRARNRFFGDKTVFNENPPQLAPGAFLFRQRRLQLFFGNEILLQQHFAHADFLRAGRTRLLAGKRLLLGHNSIWKKIL